MNNFLNEVLKDLQPSAKYSNKNVDNFSEDVFKGLQSSPKYLDSKYFYDKNGDALFQKIMASDEYYLTSCELEILSNQSAEIANEVLADTKQVDVIEFGPGDATKSIYLLKELSARNAITNYFPIDISKNIIDTLDESLPKGIPELNIHGLNGEYFEMLARVNKISKRKKLVLFLGANIGNFKFDSMPEFCNKLRSHLSWGDKVLIGFDLKKNPEKIVAAYNDSEGFTSQFNLNLLSRINNELHADFDLQNFKHYAMYDPDNGACKSYLVSLKEQQVSIDKNMIQFNKDETIFMEISQKYTVSQIDETAFQCGFEPGVRFFDKRNYFVDVIWNAAGVSILSD